jgi:hypothetical protein
LALLPAIALFCTRSAHADTFSTGPNGFTIDFVTIGNAGNGGDFGAGGGVHHSSGLGSVGYEYRISTTEISWGMIAKATASGLTGVVAGGWGPDRPASQTTWFEAAKFVNWLNTSNGFQPAYNLNFNNTLLTLWSSADAWQLDGENRFRHKDAVYFIPSENEWCKAAFHKNDGVTANYWDYATASNSVPLAVTGGTLANTAVFDHALIPAEVSNAGGLSAYGTMAQDGNVWEWMESAYDGTNSHGSEGRTVRGGYFDGSFAGLRSGPLGRTNFGPATNDLCIGFRVASTMAVPEPGTIALLIVSSMALFGRRRLMKFPRT